MPDLMDTLPDEVEQGAVRSLNYQTDIVTTDSGAEVRNGRWSTPLRVYDIAYPAASSTDANYLAVLQLYEDASGELLSFNFTDWIDGATVEVRFDSPLETQTPIAGVNQVVAMRLKEVR